MLSTPSETASSRKLSPSSVPLSSMGQIYVPDVWRDCELQGNGVIPMVSLMFAIAYLHWSQCESPMHVVEDTSVCHGLVTYLGFKCSKRTWSMCVTGPARVKL